MKKAAFFLALFFASLAPAAVFAASCAQPAAVLVFSAVENDSSEECRSLPAHALKELVETFDMYMTPGISDPVTDLGFSVADEEGESSDEVYLTPETVVSGDAGYGDPSGSEDAAVKTNRDFHELLTRLGVAHTYTEAPGVHNWAFWDTQIQRVLDWLPL